MFKLTKKYSEIFNEFLFTLHTSLLTHKGFTLAEVMVVLGILGVLAAFLVPAIFQTAPNNNKVMFKKAYYTLEQAVSNMINDDNSYPSVTTGTPPLERGFNNTNATTLSNGINKFCYYLTNELNTVEAVTCPAYDASPVTNGYFTTTDGVAWTIFYPTNGNDSAGYDIQFPMPPTASLYATKIVVDVNGSKNPNCTADTGGNAAPYSLTLCSDTSSCSSKPDTFIVGIRYDGKLQIGSGDSTDACATDILEEPTRNN